jgi:hypothetical protein
MGAVSEVPLSLCQGLGEEIENGIACGNAQGLGNHSGLVRLTTSLDV